MRQVSPRLSSTPACVPAQVDAHVTVSSHLLLSPCESLARPPREQAPRPGKTSLREQWREAHEESPPQRASRWPPINACSGRCRAMSMREAGIARTGHTRLPTAARGARLPANQGSLVWGNHMMVLTKPLQSSVPTERGSAEARRNQESELESFGETPDELVGQR